MVHRDRTDPAANRLLRGNDVMKIALATVLALSLAVAASCSPAPENRSADDLPDVMDDVDGLTESTNATESAGTTETIVATGSSDSSDVSTNDVRTVVIEEISGESSHVTTIDATPATDEAELLSDSDLTYAEYQEAFRSFSNCVQTAGHDFHSVWTDQETGQIHVTYRDESLTVVDQCYFTHFADVDRHYQTTNSAVLEKRRRQEELVFEFVERPCLEDNGVAIPDGVTALEDDESLFREWVFLDMDGLCADREMPPEVLDQLRS